MAHWKNLTFYATSCDGVRRFAQCVCYPQTLIIRLTSKPDGNKNDNEVFLYCDDSHRSGGMHSDTATDAKAQQSKVSPTRTLDMEALCKAQAAQRYNTGAQKLLLPASSSFRGAMRCVVIPPVKRVCLLFDADGQFYIFYAVKAAPGEV